MKISSNRSSAAACLQPGDKVHIKFADTNLYLCEVPDYNGYAAVAGSALAKATFKVELNSCYDACITEPAGERTQFFELGTQFIQLRHLGTDDGRRFKLKGWRYYYHATTSSGKYDTHRPDNSKQFFLINGTDTTVEYGKRCKLLDVAYFGTTCVRMQDKVKRAIKIIGPAPQYWLSAKYASTIEKCHPMYHDDIVFELAVDQCRSSAVLVPSDQEEVTTPDESYEHYTHDDQADLEKPTTITIKELTKFNLPFGAVVDRAWYGFRQTVDSGSGHDSDRRCQTGARKWYSTHGDKRCLWPGPCSRKAKGALYGSASPGYSAEAKLGICVSWPPSPHQVCEH